MMSTEERMLSLNKYYQGIVDGLEPATETKAEKKELKKSLEDRERH